MRTVQEIREEKNKVEVEKRQAEHKVISCDDRLYELDNELEKAKEARKE